MVKKKNRKWYIYSSYSDDCFAGGMSDSAHWTGTSNPYDMANHAALFTSKKTADDFCEQLKKFEDDESCQVLEYEEELGITLCMPYSYFKSLLSILQTVENRVGEYGSFGNNDTNYSYNAINSAIDQIKPYIK